MVFPPSICEPLTVYLQGEVTFVDDQNKAQLLAFILTAVDGNPHVFFYDQEENVYESFNVMLARAENSQDDILFTGDDHNTEGFLAWKRLMD